MKGSAFIWLITMIGFVIFGLIWIAFGQALSIITGITDSLITNPESVTIYTLVKGIITYWPFIILMAMVIYLIINSQKTSEVYV